MKCVQVLGPNDLVIQETEQPKVIDDHDVLVKTKRVGICGSDMHIYHGTNPLATYPRVIGHEVTGEVIEIGPNVTKVRVGDHVVVEPISYCGECYACRKGRPNVCKQLSVFGVHEDGGMRDFFTLQEKQLHVVNSILDWEDAVLAEPMTIGAQSVWRGNVEEGDSVLIQGCGPVGICALKMAKLKGAFVYMTDLDESRLQFAKKNGADVILQANDKNLVNNIMEKTRGEGINVVIDAVCIPQTFELGVRIASPAGTVVCLGFTDIPSNIQQLPITKKELTIVGSRLQTNQFPEVISLLNNRTLQMDEFITQTFKIEDIKEAFDFIEKNPDKVRKALITFE